MASDWFRIRDAGNGIHVIEEPDHVQSFLVNGDETSLLIDTGMGFTDIRAALAHLLRNQVMVANTHWHFDHIGGNASFEEIHISETEAGLIELDIPASRLRPLYTDTCVREGAPLPRGFDPGSYTIAGTRATGFLTDGLDIDLGNRAVTAFSTPGHTRGSMSFLDRQTGSLFVGDLVYQGSLYAQFRDSSVSDYCGTLTRLLSMGDDIRQLFTCHNRPDLPPVWLSRALDGFERIRSGTAPSAPWDWTGHACRIHQFTHLNILVPPENSPGINLFPAD